MKDKKPQSLHSWLFQIAITVIGFTCASAALAADTPAGFFTSVLVTIGLVSMLPDSPEEPRILKSAALLSDQHEAHQRLGRGKQ